MPSIFRPNSEAASLSKKTREKRFDILTTSENYILQNLSDHLRYKNHFIPIKKFQALRWALLQHYNVCPTPLLDITQSLRVAASFATQDDDLPYGIIYVFGLPHTNGNFSYNIDEEIVSLRLQSVCPPEASRPHFQEGYVAGTFPFSNDSRYKDFRRRLIAKFKVGGKKFWDDNFKPIPQDALIPQDDFLEEFFNKLKIKNSS